MLDYANDRLPYLCVMAFVKTLIKTADLVKAILSIV